MGGLLFFLIFSVMNAGFYLYGANAMQYAADIGVATIAAEGNYDNTESAQPNNADTIAISRMDTDGLNSTPLVKVTEVDIYKENVVGWRLQRCERLRRGGLREPVLPRPAPAGAARVESGRAQRRSNSRLREARDPLQLHAADRDADLQQHDRQPLPAGATAVMRRA